MDEFKKTTIYQCSKCGNKFNRWASQCPSCNSWNTLTDSEIKNQNNKSEDQTMFLLLVIITLGIAGAIFIWIKNGFVYGLLTSIIYGIGAYLMFYTKK